MPGNHPTSTILAPELTPSVLGQLVALYEHTVFVEGTVWGIDSFDQWGVELGKVMAGQLAPVLSAEVAPDLSDQDSSTAGLVRAYRAMRAVPGAGGRAWSARSGADRSADARGRGRASYRRSRARSTVERTFGSRTDSPPVTTWTPTSARSVSHARRGQSWFMKMTKSASSVSMPEG
jgi:hypothetical protein